MTPPAPPPPASRLIAILAADAAGYTRLMSIDDRLTVELLDAARAVFRSTCQEHQGRVVDMAGDSVLLAFDSANAALRCALAAQQRLAAPPSIDGGTLRLPFRIGVHLGDVIQKDDGSVYGDGVNLAARLQTLAEPDEVMVSQAIRDLIGARPIARFEDAGEHRLKNVAEPVRAWRALPPGAAPAPASATTAGDGLHFAGRFELQPHERRLLVDGEPAAIGARAFDLLVELARQPGLLRTKNDLLQTVWPGVVVEEGNLATQISTLRKVLGGDVIATIPGRGYRFTLRMDGGSAASGTAATEGLAAAPPQAATTAPAPEAPKLQTNLPATLPHLVGRSEDLAALNELVARHRLVSIIGAGGMGKTTVALHLTAGRQHAHRHGVCWVELATVADPEALPSAIAAAIGVRTGTGDPLDGLSSALMPLEMFVVLDNAEQVVDGVARVVQAVLDKAPDLRFVVTTQVPLKLPAERAYRIGALAVPQGPLPATQALEFSAVALFAERAQAADTRFTLTDANAPAVIELCRQLDGLALAIELAAARAPMLGVQRLADSMADRLKMLTGSRNRLAPARQQTLRAALEWSHGFLEPAEQAVFRRLSVFAGSMSLSMAQQVVVDPPDTGGLDEWAVLDGLALLVDRSLVVAMTNDDTAEPRYRLLETPRLFAQEKLQQAGEEESLRRRHAHAVAARFEAAYDEYYAGAVGVEAWRLAMDADLDNGREALAWTLAHGDAVRALQTGATLLRLLAGGASRERFDVADAIEPFIDDVVDASLLSRTMAVFSHTYGYRDRERGLALVRRLAARLPPAGVARSAPDRWALHQALAAVARVEARAGHVPEAEAALGQARELVDPAWPPARKLVLVQTEGFCALARGDVAGNLEATRKEVALGALDAAGLTNLVDAELAAGDAVQAVATGTALVASLVGGRNEATLLFARTNLSAALLSLDRQALAAQHLRAGWAQAPLFDMLPYLADYLALLAALEERFEPAARIAGYADAANARAGEREPNEANAIARATALARAALGDATFDRLHAEGTLLRDADIAALAFPDPPPA
ncbi:MAG: adenylate/guanylate cyclase domain-containing protein [Piscinibacter sp.]